jgi:hypothetical protein
VTDTVTGLIWLKDPLCFFPAQTDYATANTAAALLENGNCGLSDGSAAGDWRLPTKGEWEAVYKSACAHGDWHFPMPGKSGTGCFDLNPWAIAPEWIQWYPRWSSTSAGSEAYAFTPYLAPDYITDTYDRIAIVGFIWPVRSVE